MEAYLNLLCIPLKVHFQETQEQAKANSGARIKSGLCLVMEMLCFVQSCLARGS